MQYLSLTASLLKYAQHGALLLALGTAGPAAWGQRFGLANSYPTGPGDGPYAVAVGDLTGDGRPDIATVHMVAGTVVVLPGRAGGGWGQPLPDSLAPAATPPT